VIPPSPVTTTPAPVPAPSPVPTLSPSTPPGPGTITGDFRFNPSPDGGGGVSVVQGNPFKVNANGFDVSDPSAELRLIVAWGDGDRDQSRCGPCRVQHAYAEPGVYTLEASVTDTGGSELGARTVVTKRLSVRVESRREGGPIFSPFAFSPNPPNPIANFTLAFSVSDPTGTTVQWTLNWTDPAGALIGCSATPGPGQPPPPVVGTASGGSASVTLYCEPSGVPGTVSFGVSGTNTTGASGSRSGTVTIP
jgi:hypothetical protein